MARLAGMPAAVINRAKEILAQLESGQGGRAAKFDGAARSSAEQPMQMGLFGNVDDRLRDELRKIDVVQMTPVEALNMLHKLTEEAKK